MGRVFTKEELKDKNIYLQGSKETPDAIELLEDRIVVRKGDEVFEIPSNTLRAKALIDRLNYKGEHTQEIYI